MELSLVRCLCLTALPAFAFSAAAQDAPTFYQEALPVFQKNCVACHQPDGPSVGGIYAPMSLIDYEQAKLWAPLIRNALVTGYMPPWGAHERHRGEFKGERYIDKNEKDLLIAWVDGGALEGDPEAAANSEGVVASSGGTTLPESGWWIGDPDLVVAFDEPVYVPDQVQDWQPTVQMKYEEGAHKEPRWVSMPNSSPAAPGCITLSPAIWESAFPAAGPSPIRKAGACCCRKTLSLP